MTLLKQTRTGFFIAMIGLLLVSVISPVITLASEDLVPGDDAVVSIDTNLYTESSLEADVRAEVVEETPVTVQDGPFTADDGAIWYFVRVWDLEGYIPAVDLDGVDVTEAATEAEPATDNAMTEEEAASLPWKEPVDFGVASDNVTCRNDASTSGDEITIVTGGQTIEITGVETWVDGVSWTPVNCTGVGGFVATDFITAAAVEEEVAEVVEETTEVVDETTETVEQQVDEAVTDVEEQVNEAVTDVEEQITAGPWQQPIGTAYTADDVICRAGATTDAPQVTVISVGAVVEVTGTETWTGDMSWTPVNCAGVGGFIATDFLGAELAGDPVEAAPAEEAAAEAVVEDAAPEAEEAINEEVAIEAPADDAATEEPTTENAAETDEAAGEVADDATPEDAASEEAATEDVAETDETATAEVATEDAATEEPVTEEAVEDEASSTGVTVAETESTSPVDDDAIIGTAEVRGTSGQGIACRTAPNADASVIRVMPEGLTVFVLSEADESGWMSILCNDEVGFAHSMYLYSGGAASEFTASGSSNGYVTNTGGGGLNCRSEASINSSVIGYFPAGSAVNVRGAAQGDWVPVVCGGSNGWVHGDFLTAKTSSSGSTSGNTSTSVGTATVVGTNGDGLRCRSGAGTGSSVITVMAEGTRVSVRGGAEGSWLPITCASQNGFGHVDFLSTSGGSGNTDSDSGDSSDGGVTSGTVTVSGTGGSSLNCRSGAGTSYSIVTSVREGTVLNVRGAASNGWQPVVCGGSNAWVSTMYITAGGSTGDNDDAGNGSGGDTDAVTGTATVVNTSGDGLRCRTAPNGSVITVLAPNATVSLRAETSGDWQGVVCAGQNGFAHSDYLRIGGNTPNPDPEPSQPSGFSNGDHAKTTANLNLRYEPSSGAGVATYAPAGTVVLITGGHAGNGYFPVNWDGLKGFMHGDYLTKTTEALSKRGGSASPSDPPPTSGGSSATGNAIVDYAMGYVGYPYVWATHGPASFDCSGFTYWVIKNVVGKDIGYGLWTQVSAGQSVGRSSLQPGDLVFFQNTYKAGLSHVGIYIGDNKFVHAQNEATGVVVSDLNSNYYGSRWYGAVRIR